MMRAVRIASAALLGCVAFGCLNATAATFAVSNTMDAGTGSLREALTFAQTCAGGPHTVTFAIGGAGPHTIQPLSQLPALTCTDVLVNGYSQPGSAANSDTGATNNADIRIVLDGQFCPSTCNGITVQAPGAAVAGLAIKYFPDFGIYVDSAATGARVEGNYIGTDPGGAVPYPNASGGVHAGASATIGGAAAQRNLVTGNPEGVLIFASNVTVQSNQIGGTRGGGTSLGNLGAGIRVYSGYGLISGNHIVGNGSHGLHFDSFSSNAANNIVTNNAGAGAYLGDSGSNLLDGNTFIQNMQGGVEIDSSNNLVSNNLVTSNTPFGVRVFSGTQNQIEQTRAYANGGRGIVHGTGAGGAANDEAAPPYDTDSGPNELQNHPVIASVSHVGGNTLVSGTIKTSPGGMPARLEFFGNPAMPALPEGQTFVGALDVTLDGNGLYAFTHTLTGLHNYITATATVDVCGDLCNVTSEFSPAMAVGAAPPASGMLTPNAMSFGPTQVGTVGPPQQATLTNTGSAAFSVTGITLTGPFQFAAGGTCMIGSPIAPGGNCAVQISHAPPVAGGASGQLSIAIDAGMTFVTSLNGAATSAPAPALTAEPGSMDFGSVAPGTVSAGKTLTITNTGSAPANITSIQISGAFDITLSSSEASAAKSTAKAVGVVCPSGSFTLFPNNSCTANVRFLPQGPGIYNGEVTIDSNAPFVSVPLRGTSGELRTIAVAPEMISFGEVVFGRTSAERAFSITNTGSSKVTISSLQLAPSSTDIAGQVSDFILTHNCTSLEPAAANAGSAANPASSCSGAVRFKPGALGQRAAAVNVAGDFEGGSRQVPLTGVGIASSSPLLTFSATHFGFGQTTLGVAQNQSFTIGNGGLLPVTLSGIFTMGDFVVRHNCPEVLAPGSTCDITTSFVPMIPGQREGFLVIASNAEGSPHRFPLEGKACRGFSPRTARLDLVTCAQ
jgi:parallel beta-helix repeat protein